MPDYYQKALNVAFYANKRYLVSEVLPRETLCAITSLTPATPPDRVRGWTRLSEATANRRSAPWRTKGDVLTLIELNHYQLIIRILNSN